MIRAKLHCASAAAALLVVGAGLVLVAADAPPALVERTVKSLGTVEKAALSVVISPNGERLAYLVYRASREAPWRVVVCDGREGMQYLDIIRNRLHFSPDGKRFAYLAIGPQGQVLVCDGTPKPAWVQADLAFSPDSRHVAYEGPDGRILRDGRPDSDQAFIRKPGVVSPDCQQLIFSPDSQHLAYLAGFPTRVVCDGKSGPTYKEGVLGKPVFAPDSRSYAHTLSQGDKIGDKWVVLWADKKVGGPYDMVEGIAFSPDSKRIAYRALARDTWSVVVNDKKGPDFSNIGAIVFSPDGKHMAYGACDDEGWQIVCDGRKGLAGSEVGDPVFSADSKHLAYRVIKDGKALVVCDDRESASFDQITWVGFTPNSNHLAFAAARGKDKFVVCDGVEGPPHERLMVPERACDIPFKMRYVVIDKDEASLVEVDWPTDRTWENAFKGSKP